MPRSFRWLPLLGLLGAALVGCATAAEDATVDGGPKKDASSDLGDDTIDENGGGGDSWAVDETGEEDAVFPADDSGTTDLDSTTADDTGSPVVDTGTLTKDSGLTKDTGVPPTDTGPSCVVVEGFESGSMSGWSTGSTGGAPTFPSTSAHDGTHGMTSSSASGWYYRTTPSVGKVGDRLFAWVRGSGGRTYLGFSAGSGGAKSFVIAPNTGDIRFQDNTGWTYGELTSKATTFVATKWYKAEIVFGAGGSVTGNLYDSDGTTRLSTVTHAFGSVAVGGVALRDWALSVDTITFCPAP